MASLFDIIVISIGIAMGSCGSTNRHPKEITSLPHFSNSNLDILLIDELQNISYSSLSPPLITNNTDNNNNNMNDNNNNNDNDNDNTRIFIEHLYIAPFADTLNENIICNNSDHYIINNYLIPYFNKHPNQLISISFK